MININSHLQTFHFKKIIGGKCLYLPRQSETGKAEMPFPFVFLSHLYFPVCFYMLLLLLDITAIGIEEPTKSWDFEQSFFENKDAQQGAEYA